MHLRSVMWSRFVPQSAKAKLAVIFMVATTALMGVFGAGSYYLTQQRLTEQKTEFRERLQTQLAQPVAKALWVYDLPGLNATLDAQLSASVQGLMVFDNAGSLVTQREWPRAHGNSGKGSDIETYSFVLPEMAKNQLGRVQVIWSDAELKSTLSETLWFALTQLVGMNLVLLGILWFGVDRFIFRRVRRLQWSLDHAASREMSADIVALPVAAHDEFDEITRSINVITRRLGEELDAGRESEEEARTALTNLESAQEGLIRAEKMAALGRLVAGVAHELNTPIGNTVMVASAQHEVAAQLSAAVASGTLTRSALAGYAQRLAEGADLILVGSQRAAELIQGFKQVAVDQTTDQLRDFDLAGQLAEVLAIIPHVFSRTGVRLVQELEPGIMMRSFPGPLGQVVTNLVVNAITHGFTDGQEGTVTVRCIGEGDRVCISVADDGHGIPAENTGKIFDPFFTTRLGRGGTGLGLHISHNIVYGPLGGTIQVQTGPGKGTVFFVHIPRQAPVAVMGGSQPNES